MPALAGNGSRIAKAVQSGGASQTCCGRAAGTSGVRCEHHGQLVHHGLNFILLVAAIIAFVSGVISLATIRGKDFVAQSGPAVADG